MSILSNKDEISSPVVKSHSFFLIITQNTNIVNRNLKFDTGIRNDEAEFHHQIIAIDNDWITIGTFSISSFALNYGSTRSPLYFASNHDIE